MEKQPEKPERKTSAAQLAAVKRWNAKNRDHLSLSYAKKGLHRERWEEAAARKGQTLTKWALAALDEAAARQGITLDTISASATDDGTDE